uniref:Gap junction protein n=1 Tax=Knipowitschia caucasica TaxID=637954 RepID=A0AAV2K0T9_KNICA
MISTPTIMYLGFAMHKIARMDDEDYKPRRKMPMVNRGPDRDYEEAEDNGEEDPMILEEIEPEKEKKDKDKPSKKYVLYGLEVVPSYVCTRSPCPHTVDCFVSRPTEKTIFLRIMYAVSVLCLLFTLLEILHLGFSGVRECLCRPRPRPRRHDNHSKLGNGSTRHRGALCQQPSAPPGYNTAIKKGAPGKMAFRDNLDSGRDCFGDGSSRDHERLRKHLKLAQQHLDLAYANDANNAIEGSPTRSSSPESNTTAVEQNRLNYAQEKQTANTDKGTSQGSYHCGTGSVPHKLKCDFCNVPSVRSGSNGTTALRPALAP